VGAIHLQTQSWPTWLWRKNREASDLRLALLVGGFVLVGVAVSAVGLAAQSISWGVMTASVGALLVCASYVLWLTQSRTEEKSLVWTGKARRLKGPSPHRAGDLGSRRFLCGLRGLIPSPVPGVELDCRRLVRVVHRGSVRLVGDSSFPMRFTVGAVGNVKVVF